MSKFISAEKFQQTCEEALREFRILTRDALQQATDKTAQSVVKSTREKAPKRTGAYAKDWTSKKDWDTSTRYGRTVYNRKHYRLAHLLQNGHGLEGWVARYTRRTFVDAIPHIPTDDDVEKLYETNLRKEMEIR